MTLTGRGGRGLALASAQPSPNATKRPCATHDRHKMVPLESNYVAKIALLDLNYVAKAHMFHLNYVAAS